LEDFEQLCRAQPVTLALAPIGGPAELGGACLLLDDDVGRAGHLAELSGHGVGQAVELIEVLPENPHGHFGRGPGEDLLDPLGEEGLDAERGAGELFQHLADLLAGLLGRFAMARAEIHVNLAVVGAPDVFGKLGPSHLLTNLAHHRHRGELLLYRGAHAERFGQ
jgi:hypothetical protein